LEEILLIDDASTHGEIFVVFFKYFWNFKFFNNILFLIFLENLKKPLEDAISAYKKVKLIRLPVRVGLIKARMFGCVNAHGPALVFMDAHTEVTLGW
jgi:glycosyltransferase involved in cell wall biosynthesis